MAAMAKMMMIAIDFVEHDLCHFLQFVMNCSCPSSAYTSGSLFASPDSPSPPVGVGITPNFGYIFSFDFHAFIGNTRQYDLFSTKCVIACSHCDCRQLLATDAPSRHDFLEQSPTLRNEIRINATNTSVAKGYGCKSHSHVVTLVLAC